MRKEIQDAFERIQVISGQKGQHRALNESIDELTDHLNEVIQRGSDEKEKLQAEQAIEELAAVKDNELSQVKLAELEGRGKGSTVSRDRAYSRLVDGAIAAIRAAIDGFL